MNTLLQELKRRNVLRVAVLYVVFAWLTLQVADVLFGFLEVPDWSGKLVLALLLLGFPSVLIFAWAFEITPEGIKRESEVDRTQSITAQTGRKMNILTGVLAGIAILLIVVQGFVPGLMRSSATIAEKPAGVSHASIAVLPFVDMSAAGDQEYLSDGLSEELLNLLAKIPELTVISRTSSFQFKGKNEDVRTIAQKLGVAHVLEGSVRKSANRVRITAQLINAADGSHLWSETYDRDLDDIFAVQDEIAGAVVGALKVTLLGDVPQVRSARQNTEAYNFLLQARFFKDQRTTEASRKAVAYLQQALAVDSAYAPAWAELSTVITDQVGRGDLPVGPGSVQARKAAQRAVELDPKLPDAYIALAYVDIGHDWDWAAAEAHLRKAEALDPANFRVLQIQANLAATLGRFAEAVSLDRRLTAIDPLHATHQLHVGLALVSMDSLTAAEAAFRKALELNPMMSGAHTFLARVILLQGKPQEALAEMLQERHELWRAVALPLVYHALGRHAESDAALRELEQHFGDEAAFQVAEAHAYRGEIDLAFKWLDRAYAQRDPGVTEIKGDPLLKNLERDPRYQALLRKLKLPES